MTDKNDIVLFQKRLAETIEWCTLRTDPDDAQGSLRSPNLRPIAIKERYQDNFKFDWYTVGVGKAAIDHMANKRAELLSGDAPMPFDLPAVPRGRLLLSEPLYSLDEALAQSDSQGFFDCYDVPPWDTWVWLITIPTISGKSYDRVCLISWVPPSLVDLAQKGIDANPMDCIAWVTDKVGLYPFIMELNQADLLL